MSSDGCPGTRCCAMAEDDDIIMLALLRGAAMLADDDDDGENRQGQGPRERAERLPTAQTTWWKDIHSDAIRRPGSRVAKLFRRRYRVSFERFLQLVEMTKGWEYPDPANPDKQKKVFPQQRTYDDQKIVFVEIKVMLALRWLGSGASFDMLGELSQTSETCARVSCETWCSEFVKRHYYDYVKVVLQC